MTSRLLAFSRKEASVSRVLDLNAVVASGHEMLRRLIGADVELVTVPSDAPCPVEVDPEPARPGVAQPRHQRP